VVEMSTFFLHFTYQSTPFDSEAPSYCIYKRYFANLPQPSLKSTSSLGKRFRAELHMTKHA